MKSPCLFPKRVFYHSQSQDQDEGALLGDSRQLNGSLSSPTNELLGSNELPITGRDQAESGP